MEGLLAIGGVDDELRFRWAFTIISHMPFPLILLGLSFVRDVRPAVRLIAPVALFFSVRPVLLFFEMLKRLDNFSDAIASRLTLSSLPTIIVMAAFAISFYRGSHDAEPESRKHF